MTDQTNPAEWDPALDAAAAAPANHKVVFENDNLRVLEVILEADAEEPVHHHRWLRSSSSIRSVGRSTILRRTAPNCRTIAT
jgi:hypothetical protein